MSNNSYLWGNNPVSGGGKLTIELSTILKFIACIVIALHHYSQNAFQTGASDSIILKLFSVQGGWSGVALFFFLSGYGLMESEKRCHLNIIQFIRKRFWKIYKPLLVTNFLTFGFIVVWGYCETLTWETGSWKDIFFFTRFDYYFWFVSVLFVCYSFFCICVQFKSQQTRNIFLLITTCVVCLAFYFNQEAVNHWASIPLFTLGCLFSEYAKTFFRIVNKWYCWIIMAFISCLVILFSVRIHDMTFIHVLINVIQTWLLLTFVALSRPCNFKLSLFEISYPIYLIHHKVIDSSLYLGNLLPVGVYIVVVIYLGWLLHKTIAITNLRWKNN